jgi:hypothetical protein
MPKLLTMLATLDADMMGTMLMAAALVLGAALALWSLPWTDAELEAVNHDAREAAKRFRRALSDRDAHSPRTASPRQHRAADTPLPVEARASA